MTEAASFHAFSPSHWAVLGLCAAVLGLLAALRRCHERSAVWGERLLGSLLLLHWPANSWVYWQAGTLSLQNGLPLHFCDIAGIAGGLALWTRRQWPCEIVYFFGLAGTLQGLLTPNLKVDYPDPRFAVFFLLHGGVVIAALHVVTSMRHAPRPGAVGRLVALTLLYGGLGALINALLGTNYGFLCRKPEQASLMDSLGPWPWYVGSLALLAAALFSLLNAPFALGRRLRARAR